jgi:hypothetical protein
MAIFAALASIVPFAARLDKPTIAQILHMQAQVRDCCLPRPFV